MKTALVTGAAGGIGFACVQKLTEEGYYVVGADIADKNGRFAGLKNAQFVPCDLTDAAARKNAVDTAFARGNRLDVLINAAGVAPVVRRDLLEMTEESYDRVTGINTRALFFVTQYAARRMLENPAADVRGYIVNISSMSAYTSSVSRGEYCISKAGVTMITRLFADRLAGEGIIVNEIRPGIIATGMTETVKDKYDALIAGGLLPVARWGRPEDIAAAAAALCSGQFAYTTGQSIDVDGGFHLRRL